MTTRRVIIGRRANGALGVFVAPVGIDAYTALDNQLILSISSKVAQLIKIGFVASSQSVPLALSNPPIVFITSYGSLSGVIGYEGLTGPIRPSPAGIGGGSSYTATVTVSPTSMFISSPIKASYIVYNEAF